MRTTARSTAPAEADYADAAEVCERLGIELFAANFAAEYWDNVFAAFLADYRAGRTPNPDVLCNREIKFRLFVDYAAELGYPLVATGHYARRSPLGEPFRLFRGVDRNKDQTYFLQAVPTEQLTGCIYPIGDMTKPALRQRAEAAGLPVHDKKDSTGICFIGERRFADFLARYLPDDPGPVLDMEGTTLGEHRGLAWFTIGQRQGIGIGGQAGRAEKPWYVARKDRDGNALYVTQNECDLLSRQLRGSSLNRIAGELPERCTAKTRYRQPDQPCSVDVAGNTVTVTFEAAPTRHHARAVRRLLSRRGMLGRCPHRPHRQGLFVNLEPLTAVSPLDGRYRSRVAHLAEHVSEFALIRYRVRVEVEWFVFLAGLDEVAELPSCGHCHAGAIARHLEGFLAPGCSHRAGDRGPHQPRREGRGVFRQGQGGRHCGALNRTSSSSTSPAPPRTSTISPMPSC